MIYSEKTKKIGTTLDVDGMQYSYPMPTNGVYQYIQSKVGENETKGEIKVSNNIASEQIIPFRDWKHIDMPIRVIIPDSLCISDTDYFGLIQRAELKKAPLEAYSYTETAMYTYFLLDFDGFEVSEKGVISHQDDRIRIEQIDQNFKKIDKIICRTN